MSDDTTKTIIEKITVTSKTPMIIPGTEHRSTIYYDCAQLTPGDLARLAAGATGHLGAEDFDLALGVAYTGILLASAVAGGRQVAIFGKDGAMYGPACKRRKVLIVNDVIYTGTEVSKAADAARAAGGQIVGFACIIDRSAGSGELGGRPIYSAMQVKL